MEIPPQRPPARLKLNVTYYTNNKRPTSCEFEGYQSYGTYHESCGLTTNETSGLRQRDASFSFISLVRWISML